MLAYDFPKVFNLRSSSCFSNVFNSIAGRLAPIEIIFHFTGIFSKPSQGGKMTRVDMSSRNVCFGINSRRL